MMCGVGLSDTDCQRTDDDVFDPDPRCAEKTANNSAGVNSGQKIEMLARGGCVDQSQYGLWSQTRLAAIEKNNTSVESEKFKV